jgi:hypothetical protein
LEQVEKALVGPLIPNKSTPLPTTACSYLGSATAANAFNDIERPTAAETAALSARSFVEFAVPFPPPVAAVAAAASVIEIGSMATPNVIHSADRVIQIIDLNPDPEPQQVEQVVQVEQVEQVVQVEQVEQVEQAEQVDILAIAIAVADPPSDAPAQTATTSRSQVAGDDNDANNNNNSSSFSSPISDNDRQRLKAIVKKVSEAIVFGKKDPLAVITDAEDSAIIRRLRKRGSNDSLTPLGKELLNFVSNNDVRRRLFSLLTNRSIHFWKKSGPTQAMRNNNNNNDNV